MHTIEFIHRKDAAVLGGLKKFPMRAKSFFLTFLLLCVFPNMGNAQTEEFYSLMNLAKGYSQQKEYLKSNECYEQALEVIKPFDENCKLTNQTRGLMALNYLHLGIPLFKAKNYTDSKRYFEKAIEYSANVPKVLSLANTWMGDWHSMQALRIRIAKSDLQQAVEYSISAERYYTSAKAPEKCLKEQISRAAVLAEIYLY